MSTTQSTTTTSTINYSGLLRSRKDKRTRFLDAIYQRGKNGGTRKTDSIEFVLSSGYELEDGSQPDISETASMTAPAPDTTARDQEFNVVQIFQRSVKVSYLKQQNKGMLGGVNNANQESNVQNEIDFQVGKRVEQLRIDLNHTVINGVYQYTKGSQTVAPRSRGILAAIQTNRFVAAGATFNQALLDDALMNAIANGASPESMEIWCNPAMLRHITDSFALAPGFNLPETRTEGGMAITRILTPYGVISVEYEPEIPDKKIALLNMGEIAVAEMDYIDENGVNYGAMFYEPLAKTGAAESGQLYATLGTDYGAEWLHALLDVE